MRLIFVAAVVACTACGLGGNNQQWKSTGQAITCDQGETATYANRFTPQNGGSGVATGADAAAGKINSDDSSGGVSGGDVKTGGDPTPGGGGSGSTGGSSQTPPDAGDLTAMVASCTNDPCAPGLVAVELPPAPTGGATGGVATGAAIDDAAPPSDASPPPTPPSDPAPIVKCVAPPPDCQPGFSPQYTGHDTWECTDCSLVVTYGGIYGNYRRCVNAPTIQCQPGQVPTWSYELEIWECKDTCDNGMYDQHTIKGQLVCVPC